MRRFALAAPLLAALLVLAACGDDGREAGRAAARRDWCIAEELAVQANEAFSKIDTVSAGGEEPLLGSLLVVARAQHGYAKAREREMALLDSAARAVSPQDSASYARRALESRPRAASQLEETAAGTWQRRFAEALGNPSHPCHQIAAGR